MWIWIVYLVVLSFLVGNSFIRIGKLEKIVLNMIKDDINLLEYLSNKGG